MQVNTLCGCSGGRKVLLLRCPKIAARQTVLLVVFSSSEYCYKKTQLTVGDAKQEMPVPGLSQLLGQLTTPQKFNMGVKLNPITFVCLPP